MPAQVRVRRSGESEEVRVAQTGVVAQIEFTELRPDGHLRHAKFSGLRDKNPHGVVREWPNRTASVGGSGDEVVVASYIDAAFKLRSPVKP